MQLAIGTLGSFAIVLIGGLLLVGLILLIWAPMKLYDIHRDLQMLNANMKEQNELLRVHTPLLASIANAADPVE